jgi:hypothetical protein
MARYHTQSNTRGDDLEVICTYEPSMPHMVAALAFLLDIKLPTPPPTPTPLRPRRRPSHSRQSGRKAARYGIAS